MLIGLYTNDGDLELGRSAQGLMSLAERLIRNRETHFDLALSTSGVDPTPYDGVLSRLSVKIGESSRSTSDAPALRSGLKVHKGRSESLRAISKASLEKVLSSRWVLRGYICI